MSSVKSNKYKIKRFIHEYYEKSVSPSEALRRLYIENKEELLVYKRPVYLADYNRPAIRALERYTRDFLGLNYFNKKCMLFRKIGLKDKRRLKDKQLKKKEKSCHQA
jgi:hypothetical protein